MQTVRGEIGKCCKRLKLCLDPAFLKFEQDEYEQAIKASMQHEEERKLKEQ